MTVVVNPATEEAIAEVPEATAEGADRAVEAAHRAFPAWRAVAPGDRVRLLRTIKRVTLELGGKSANVVFADADPRREAAADGAPSAVFGNAGQDCCAGSRIPAERSVYDRFLELLVERTAGVRVGDPEDDATEIGPLISAAHREKVSSYANGTVAFRGDTPDSPRPMPGPPSRLPSCREAAGDRERGAVPGERRVVVRERRDVPGRRRPDSRLRHAGIDSTTFPKWSPASIRSCAARASASG